MMVSTHSLLIGEHGADTLRELHRSKQRKVPRNLHDEDSDRRDIGGGLCFLFRYLWVCTGGGTRMRQVAGQPRCLTPFPHTAL